MARANREYQSKGLSFLSRAAMRRTFIFILVAVAFAPIVIIAWGVSNAVTTARHAEHAFHAVLLTSQLTTSYVIEHQDWPRSWSDLESVRNTSTALYQWPADADLVKQYVSIDFSAKLEDLARLDPKSFQAIQPIGSVYGTYRAAYTPLLDTIRSCQEQKSRRQLPVD